MRPAQVRNPRGVFISSDSETPHSAKGRTLANEREKTHAPVTLGLEFLAKQSPDVSIIHSFPGSVPTNLIRRGDGALMQVIKFVFKATYGLGLSRATPPVDVGERHTFYCTSARFPPAGRGQRRRRGRARRGGRRAGGGRAAGTRHVLGGRAEQQRGCGRRRAAGCLPKGRDGRQAVGAHAVRVATRRGGSRFVDGVVWGVLRFPKRCSGNGAAAHGEQLGGAGIADSEHVVSMWGDLAAYSHH